MAKWFAIFFDTLVYVGTLTATTSTSVPIPISAYFMVATKYDLKLMTDVHKAYVLQEVASVGMGSMLCLFGCGLGLLGQFGPEEIHSQIVLPGF